MESRNWREYQEEESVGVGVSVLTTKLNRNREKRIFNRERTFEEFGKNLHYYTKTEQTVTIYEKLWGIERLTIKNIFSTT